MIGRNLANPYLKGAYLDWAPALLNAEKWHRDKNKPAE